MDEDEENTFEQNNVQSTESYPIGIVSVINPYEITYDSYTKSLEELQASYSAGKVTNDVYASLREGIKISIRN